MNKAIEEYWPLRPKQSCGRKKRRVNKLNTSILPNGTPITNRHERGKQLNLPFKAKPGLEFLEWHREHLLNHTL